MLMDLFATLFSIALDNPEAEPASATPIDADGGGSMGCIIA